MKLSLCTTLLIVLSACTPQQGHTVATVVETGLTVSVEKCHELEKQPEPDWVTIACKIAEGVESVVRVRRTAWDAMKRQNMDAGRGL